MNTKKHGLSRRAMMKLGAVAAAAASLPGWAWAMVMSHFPTRTVEVKNFDFDPATGMITWNDKPAEPYRLKVAGLVRAPAEFSYAELRGMPQVAQVSDFHCVEGWSVYDTEWGGVRFSEITARVKPLPEAKYVIFHSLGRTRSEPGGRSHYVESFPLDQVTDPEQDMLLALDLDKKTLPLDRGAPMRLVCPYFLAYKSIKFVRMIEFSDRQQPGWWTLANPIYPVDAPVPKSRLRKKTGEQS